MVLFLQMRQIHPLLFSSCPHSLPLEEKASMMEVTGEMVEDDKEEEEGDEVAI